MSVTPVECPFHGDLDIDRTSLTWGMGRVCSGCGMPVRVTVEHVYLTASPNPEPQP